LNAADPANFELAVASHDAILIAAGLDIWVGTEPTFTDRYSSDAQWSHAALGENKRNRAEALLVMMARANPGCVVLRSVGRRYGGETTARWSYGILRRRDRRPIWSGPTDPLLCKGDLSAPNLEAFATRLAQLALADGYAARCLPGIVTGELRVLLSTPAAEPVAEDDTRLQRPPVHELANDDERATDALAPAGHHLFILRQTLSRGREAARLDLPPLGDPEHCVKMLSCIARAASDSGLSALVLSGSPPPVDADYAYTTITPDPGVLEVNMAPYPCVADLFDRTVTLFSATEALGLSRYKAWYNGDAGDSGGGGHVTLGGRTPRTSPFLSYPHLLPGLIRYVNRHPSLSYLFSHDYVGAGGQSVRTDERDREHFDELGVALQLLAREPAPTPEFIWRSLAPFMADSSGNTHRAELNIEKLWNPDLPERGCLGLVEFRAFRMPESAERAAALAALLRSLCARLAAHRYDEPLIDWGAQLHERFALPFYLRQNFREVLADLEQHQFGLPPPLSTELLNAETSVLGRVEVVGARLSLRKALEFWPLMGDSSTQASGTSRVIDPSNGRIELCLRRDCDADPASSSAWHLAAQGYELPMRAERDERGPASLFAIRFRRFVAQVGMHPGLPAQGPIELLLWHDDDQARAYRITVHEWRPDGEAYEGLPANLDAAARRRQQRIVCTEVAREPTRAAPAEALSACTLDLRRL